MRKISFETLFEKLNIELSLIVLDSLINDYKEQKTVNHGRLNASIT